MDNSKINSPVHYRLKLIKPNGQYSVESPSPDGPKTRLLDQFRQAIRSRHYSIKTEEAYWGWIRRFIIFYDKRQSANPNQVDLFLAESFDGGDTWEPNQRVSEETSDLVLEMNYRRLRLNRTGMRSIDCRQ